MKYHLVKISFGENKNLVKNSGHKLKSILEVYFKFTLKYWFNFMKCASNVLLLSKQQNQKNQTVRITVWDLSRRVNHQSKLI